MGDLWIGEPEVLASGGAWLEGPCWTPDGVLVIRPRSSADRLLALGASLFAVEGAHERIEVVAAELQRVASGLNNPMLPESLGA